MAWAPEADEVDPVAEHAAGEVDEADRPSVDDLFARIRAARSDAVGPVDTPTGEVPAAEVLAAEVPVVEGTADEAGPDQDAADEGEPEEPVDHDTALLRARDAALAPLRATLARQLKRALADEQNEVFDRLRRVTKVEGADDVLGTEAAHAERYRASGEDAVWAAALAGAASTATDTETPGALEGALERHRVLDEVLDEVTLEVAMPLRERLEAAIVGGGGDPDDATSLLRNAYREWKAQRIDELAGELALSAYGRGAFAAAPVGEPVRWVVDPSVASCRDEVVNAEAGSATLRRGVPDRASASSGTRRLPMPARTHPRLACAAVRIPSDTPPARPARRRRRISHRGRIILIAAVVLLLLLFLSARGIAGFWTDYLWFDALGFGGVFSDLLLSRVALAAIFTVIFAVLLCVNLWVADRLAPRFRQPGPEEQFLERYQVMMRGRRVWFARIGVSLLFGFIAGIPVASQWKDWILFTHATSFGEKDPLFGVDVGFYVFRLPFLTFLMDWLFASLVIILIITAVAHYLNGGIRLQVQGRRVTPQVKAHLSVLLALLAILRAAGYWLQRYELLTSTRGFVDGATYTAVKAELPAINLLFLISLLAAVLLLVNIWQRGLAAPDHRRRPVGSRRRRGRHHLPHLRAALRRPARRVRAGAALHRAQHRRHEEGHEPRRGDRGALPGRPARQCRAAGQRRQPPQRAPPRPRHRPRHVQAAPGAAGLLRVQRPRRRPLRPAGQRRCPAGRAGRS